MFNFALPYSSQGKCQANQIRGLAQNKSAQLQLGACENRELPIPKTSRDDADVHGDKPWLVQDWKEHSAPQRADDCPS